VDFVCEFFARYCANLSFLRFLVDFAFVEKVAFWVCFGGFEGLLRVEW